MNAHANETFGQPIAYTINDACRVSGIGRTTLYALIGARALKTTKIGKRTLVNAASLRALIEGEAA